MLAGGILCNLSNQDRLSRQILLTTVQWSNSHDLGLSLDSWYCIEVMMMIVICF